jgi:hypothetical protein
VQQTIARQIHHQLKPPLLYSVFFLEVLINYMAYKREKNIQHISLSTVMENPLTVFISYTWDNDIHKDWVLNLANYLIDKSGLNVILDQYELTAGQDMNHFMENGLETADKVLIILTEKYKEKADKREGGTGFEYSMISQNLFELQAGNNKFIPILRSGSLKTSAPTYLKTRIYHPMTDDSNYELGAYGLSRIIHEKPKLVKPERGPVPNFDSEDFDPIIAIAKDLSYKDKINRELNLIIESEEGIELAIKQASKLFDKLEKKVFDYTEKTDLNFSFQINNQRNDVIVSSGGYSVSLKWSQAYRNTASDSKLRVTTWIGHLVLNSYNGMYYPREEPKTVTILDYSVDLNQQKEIIWRKSAERTETSDEIVKLVFTYLITAIKKDKEKTFRK